jgi:hypothetical protein
MNLLQLEINGYKPPSPDREGYVVTENKIWSKNTGRTASAEMVGDVIGRKYSVVLTWSDLKQDVVKLIDNAINKEAFFPVKFENQRGEFITRSFYSDDPAYGKKKQKNGEWYYSSFTITLTEK